MLCQCLSVYISYHWYTVKQNIYTFGSVENKYRDFTSNVLHLNGTVKHYMKCGEIYWYSLVNCKTQTCRPDGTASVELYIKCLLI